MCWKGAVREPIPRLGKEYRMDDLLIEYLNTTAGCLNVNDVERVKFLRAGLNE